MGARHLECGFEEVADIALAPDALEQQRLWPVGIQLSVLNSKLSFSDLNGPPALRIGLQIVPGDLKEWLPAARCC